MLAETFLDGALFGSTYSLVALGFTLIFGVIHRLNIAHGATIMVSAYAGAAVMLLLGGESYVALVLAFLASIATGTVLGYLVERIAFRPLRDASYLTPFVTTAAVTIILEELFQKIARVVPIFQPELTPFPSPLEDASFYIGNIFVRGIYVVTFLVSLALMFALARWVAHSAAGRAMRVVEENALVAPMLGIDVRRTEVRAFMVASGLAGAAGCLIGASTGSVTPFMGTHLILIGFVVIVLGGLGNIVGAMACGILVGEIEALFSRYGPPAYSDVALFVVLFLVLVVRPQGLLSRQVLAKD